MKITISIFIMAATTYFIRVLPLVVFKKPIENRFIRSFLHYVPVACLTAMTFPAILYASEHIVSGAVGIAVSLILALKKQSLITVSVSCGVAVFIVEQCLRFL